MKWEYTSFEASVDSGLESLNELGWGGWELVQVVPDAGYFDSFGLRDYAHFFLKRSVD